MSQNRPLLVFFTSQRSGPARRMESLLAHIARKERESLVVKRVVARLEGRSTAPKVESMIDEHRPAAAPALV
jgi:hypothetical protein